VTRDFAFIVDTETAAGDLLKAVRSGAGPLLSDIAVFDVYQGENIEAGKKSVAVTITLSPSKATLTDDEIDQISNSVIKLAEKNCGAVLRS
jgi:phenylalanyl-tRNA synthetase beta chain